MSIQTIYVIKIICRFHTDENKLRWINHGLKNNKLIYTIIITLTAVINIKLLDYEPVSTLPYELDEV